MTTRELIRDSIALGCLAAFREVGVFIDLKHEDDDLVSGLAAYITNTGQGVQNHPAQESISSTLALVIPRQAGFDGSARTSDLVYYPSGGSNAFTIITIEADEHEAIYRVQARKMGSPASV